jgi:CBS domain-containing protein
MGDRNDAASRKARGQQLKGEPPEPGFEQPAPPEATNRDHPSSIGSRAAVPGAGVVSAGADAGPVESNRDSRIESRYPGHGAGPLNAENARRPGTTPQGPAAVASAAGAGSSSHATETVTAGDDAPLSVPNDSVGPQPAAPDVPELYDPNYTAASRPQSGPRHRDLGPDARVSDVMARDVEYCEPDTNLEYVARKMADRDVGAIPVVDNMDSMKPVGMITDRDIAIRVIAKGQDPYSLRADEVMSTDLAMIDPDAPLGEAMMLMERKQVRRLVIVDRLGRLRGILAQADVAESTTRLETGEMLRQISEPGTPGSQGQYH